MAGNSRLMTTAQRDIIFALVRIRHECGFTAADVAERMCVERSTVTHFECAYKSPTLSTMLRYADAVGATFSVL